MPAKLPAFDDECFFITPIGDDDSESRKRADGVLDAIVAPAATALDMTAIRADRIGEGGQVNLQVIEHVYRARTAVADLTGANLNVYYEVGMRHTTRLPLVLIADESERDKVPFDLLVQRTIFFANDMNGVAACRAAVEEQLERGRGGAVDSPIDAAVNIRAFQQGDAVERTLAELVTSVDGLSRQVSAAPNRISPTAVRDLARGHTDLTRLAEEREDDELLQVCSDLAKPVFYLLRRTRATGDGDSERGFAVESALRRQRDDAEQTVLALEAEAVDQAKPRTTSKPQTTSKPRTSAKPRSTRARKSSQAPKPRKSTSRSKQKSDD
jgi:hypothetical protein